MAAKELKALSAFPEVNDSRLLPVQLKPEVGQDLPGQLLGRVGLRLALAHHDKVVRIANKSAVSTISEREVQRVQIDVRQKRRDNAALRSPRDRLPEHPFVHHTCLEPLPHELEHTPVRDSLRDLPEQPLVVDRGEVIADVGLEHEAVPVDERSTQHLLGVSGRPAWTEPKRGIQKVSLEDGLKHDTRGLLNNPILDGRDAKRPHTTPGLGDQNPPDRPRSINPLAQVTLQARPKAAPHRTPAPPPASENRPRQHPCSSAHASTPPTGRHS